MLIAVADVVLSTPLLLRGVVISTIWAFIFFSIEAAGLILLSIVILFLAGGHIGAPFQNLGGTGAAGFLGLALAFPIAISGFVGWENSGALAEEAKNPRRDIPITVFASILIVGLLALPIWGFFAPGQPAPFNSFGWIFLGLVVISVAWAIYVLAARPKATTALGTMIADE